MLKPFSSACRKNFRMEKRMAMGHKADDREEQTQYQQSM